MLGFSSMPSGRHVGVEADDPVALRVLHLVGEDRRAGPGSGAPEQIGQRVAVEDVVAEHERDGIGTDEVAADGKGLRDAAGGFLRQVGELHAEPRPVAEQVPIERKVLRRGDDEDVADAAKHQHRERIIDHRLVVDG